MTGSDYGELRERYDEEYMANYESSFIKTKDGKLSMPSYSDMYDKKRDVALKTLEKKEKRLADIDQVQTPSSENMGSLPDVPVHDLLCCARSPCLVAHRQGM